jgi:hypothetical protein
MTAERAYASPRALRQAVTNRLRAVATPIGPWTLTELQRQFAYDRLLTRLYAIDDGWVLKGAVAFARPPGLRSPLNRRRCLSRRGANDGRERTASRC